MYQRQLFSSSTSLADSHPKASFPGPTCWTHRNHLHSRTVSHHMRRKALLPPCSWPFRHNTVLHRNVIETCYMSINGHIKVHSRSGRRRQSPQSPPRMVLAGFGLHSERSHRLLQRRRSVEHTLYRSVTTHLPGAQRLIERRCSLKHTAHVLDATDVPMGEGLVKRNCALKHTLQWAT
jgi:hypothetical protein